MVTRVVEEFYFKRVANLTDEQILAAYEGDRQRTLRRRQKARELLAKQEVVQDRPGQPRQ